MSKKQPKIKFIKGSVQAPKGKASHWTKVLAEMPLKNEQRRPTEEAVIGKNHKN